MRDELPRDNHSTDRETARDVNILEARRRKSAIPFVREFFFLFPASFFSLIRGLVKLKVVLATSSRI